MFILRRIQSDLTEINTCLGIDYVLVLKEKTREEFDKTICLWKAEYLENVYGVVTFNEGKSIMPLYNNSQYYIMTSDGKTFSNISLK